MGETFLAVMKYGIPITARSRCDLSRIFVDD